MESDTEAMLLAFLPLLASTTILSPYVPELVGYLLTACVIGFCTLWVLHTNPGKLQIDHRLGLLAGSYLIGLSLLLTVAPTPRLVLYFGSSLLVFPYFFVFIPDRVSASREAFSWAFCVFGVALVAFGILELVLQYLLPDVNLLIVGEPVFGFHGLRIRSVFWNSNVLGFALMPAILAAIYRRHIGLYMPTWMLAVLFLGSLLSEAKSTYLGLFVAFMLYIVLKNGSLSIIITLTGVIGFVFAWSLGLPQVYLETGLNGRLWLWEAGLRRFIESPILGLRWSETPADAIQQYMPPEIEGREDAGPHNFYIYALLNLGIIVGGIYLLLLFSTLKSIYRWDMTPWQLHCAAVLTAMAVDLIFRSQTLGGISTSSLLIALYIGLATAATSREQVARGNINSHNKSSSSQPLLS